MTAAGGRGIAVRVDHADDAQARARALFDRVRDEQGKIDILVNNAAAIHDELSAVGSFWDKPLHLADLMPACVRATSPPTWRCRC